MRFVFAGIGGRVLVCRRVRVSIILVLTLVLKRQFAIKSRWTRGILTRLDALTSLDIGDVLGVLATRTLLEELALETAIVIFLRFLASRVVGLVYSQCRNRPAQEFCGNREKIGHSMIEIHRWISGYPATAVLLHKSIRGSCDRGYHHA